MNKPEWWFDYPLDKKLKEMGYDKQYIQTYFEKNDDQLSGIYGKFAGGYLTMPKGMAGSDLYKMRKELEKEYREIEAGKGEIEVRLRGAE